jgi:hypothetical protein
MSARNVKDDNSYDTLTEYLNSYDFKNSIGRELPEEIFGGVMTPEHIEVSLPKENEGIKKYNGAAWWYWLNDPYSGCADLFYVCSSYGSGGNYKASAVGGVAPAFRVAQ